MLSFTVHLLLDYPVYFIKLFQTYLGNFVLVVLLLKINFVFAAFDFVLVLPPTDPEEEFLFRLTDLLTEEVATLRTQD